MEHAAPPSTSVILTASDFIPEPLTEYALQEERGAGNHNGQYWNDIIIDRMFADPAIKIETIATELRKSVQWVGLMRRSDSFKLRYAQRRREFEATLKDSLTEKLIRVAEKSLDAISERLDKGVAGVKIDTLSEIADKALERLGYGVKAAAPSVVVNNNALQQIVAPVSTDELAEARRLMREFQAGRVRPITIEATANDSPLLEYGLEGVEAVEPVVGVEVEQADERAA